MAEQVTFELYILRDGRWQINDSFDATERDRAMDMARYQEKVGGNQAACLVRASFDADTGRNSEAIIYYSPILGAKPPVDSITTGGKRKKQASQPLPGSVAANAKTEALIKHRQKQAEIRKKAEAQAQAMIDAQHLQQSRTMAAVSTAGVVGDGAWRYEWREIEEADITRVIPRAIFGFLLAGMLATVVAGMAFLALQFLARYDVVVTDMTVQWVLIVSWVLTWSAIFIPYLKRAIADGTIKRQIQVKVPITQSMTGGTGSGSIGQGADKIVRPARKDPTPPRSEIEAQLAERSKTARPESARGLYDQTDQGADKGDVAAAATLGPLQALKASFAASMGGGDGRSPIAQQAGKERETPQAIDAAIAARADALAATLQPGKKQKDTPLAAAEAALAYAKITRTAVPDDGLGSEDDDYDIDDPALLEELLAALEEEIAAADLGDMRKDGLLRFGAALYALGVADFLRARFALPYPAAGRASEQAERLLAALTCAPDEILRHSERLSDYLAHALHHALYRQAQLDAGHRLKSGQGFFGFSIAVHDWRVAFDSQQQAKTTAAEPEKAAATPQQDRAIPAKNPFVAVLFTDIVGSTQAQQEKGDGWMMGVVRAHNEIVREALDRYDGREIKHLGDGIMACFDDIPDAVGAALAMQRGFVHFSNKLQDMAFQVRIAVGAGTPIQEDGDLYGTPVSLASRLLSETEPEKITVSQIVRELCRGKAYNFEKKPDVMLKGFDEPQQIYQLSAP